MLTTKNKKDHIKISLTLTFRVSSQVSYFGLFMISELEKVKIDTTI